MTETQAREAAGLDRRSFMAGAATAAIVVSGGALIHSGEAWGLGLGAKAGDHGLQQHCGHGVAFHADGSPIHPSPRIK